MFASHIIGDQIVPKYSGIALVMVVYVLSSVSLDFPQFVGVRALSIFVVYFALPAVFCMCFEKLCLGSMYGIIFYVVVCDQCCVFYN